jgi:hypothetical protein
VAIRLGQNITPQRRAGIRVLEIHFDRTLVAVQGPKHRGDPLVERRAPAARVIAAAGRFDFHHQRAQVSQNMAGHRCCHAGPDFHHRKPAERMNCCHLWRLPAAGLPIAALLSEAQLYHHEIYQSTLQLI